MVICAITTAASVVKTLQHRKLRPQCISKLRDIQIQIFIVYCRIKTESEDLWYFIVVLII